MMDCVPCSQCTGIRWPLFMMCPAEKDGITVFYRQCICLCVYTGFLFYLIPKVYDLKHTPCSSPKLNWDAPDFKKNSLKQFCYCRKSQFNEVQLIKNVSQVLRVLGCIMSRIKIFIIFILMGLHSIICEWKIIYICKSFPLHPPSSCPFHLQKNLFLGLQDPCRLIFLQYRRL